ncbi:succinylglutamate desuccinylase [Gynuella sp.]|uniref:succinylglutamate desuccinylase n=1 Tax=Gynuella sp. TaxID=2969146 RepID=UPI003D0BEE1F
MNSNLFLPGHDFLAHTLVTDDCSFEVVQQDGMQILFHATGVLEFSPSHSAGHALVLSAGVHGNETAPIEIINNLVTAILAGHIQLQCSLLIILGHPQAMRQEQRYIETNLNRLFVEPLRRNTYKPSIELSRANLLCRLVDDFLMRHGQAEKLHLDLHTAIRRSRKERFAIFPYVENRAYLQQDIQLLLAMGIEATLLMHKAGSTFSSYSGLQHGARSYTLELGRVRPFGQNDLTAYQNVYDALAAWLCEPDSIVTPDRQMEFYSVRSEVIRTGEHFELMVAADQENFSEYLSGELVWRDHEQEYRVQGRPELIVFPNPNVEFGHRAALLVQKND